MALLRRESVLPLHRQVQFGDALADDYPQWETGEERAVFTTQVIAVATRDDQQGDVQVEVWTDPIGEELEGTWILDAEIQLVGETAQFGNAVAGQLFDIALGPGWYRVQVLVTPTDIEPSLVRFIVHPVSAQQI
jgi:hypothetical protein